MASSEFCEQCARQQPPEVQRSWGRSDLGLFEEQQRGPGGLNVVRKEERGVEEVDREVWRPRSCEFILRAVGSQWRAGSRD